MIDNIEPIISLRNIGVKYKRGFSFKRGKGFHYWALKDINFDLYQGETVGITGKNGAGKSTLLKVIAGVLHPDTGTVQKRTGARIGLLTLATGFNPLLTGRQNIILSGLMLGISKEYITSKIDDIIALADIGDFIDQPLNTYSSGMGSRLGFSIAYHCTPDILLIDETLSVGDRQFKEKSAKLIEELIASDKTVVLVSHNEKTIENFCTRTVSLEHGKMDQAKISQTPGTLNEKEVAEIFE